MMMISTTAAAARLAGRVVARPHPFASLATQFLSSVSLQEKTELPPNLKFNNRTIRKSKTFVMERRVVFPKPSVDQEEGEGDASSDEKNEEFSTGGEDIDDREEGDSEGTLVYAPPEIEYVIPLPERLDVDIIDSSDFSTPVGAMKLSPIVFGRDPIRVDLIKRVVVYQRNKKRGKRTAKTKTISELRGSTRKMRPQKGTGQARQGHRRAPHWKGGAKSHGPKGTIQDYTTKLNRKTRKLGLLHVLSQKLKEKNLIIVNHLNLDSHRTGPLSKALKNRGLAEAKKGEPVLLVDWVPDDSDQESFENLPVHLKIASGNIEKVALVSQTALGVYQILRFKKLVMTVAAVEALGERLKDADYE